jgi:hypothetical protein
MGVRPGGEHDEVEQRLKSAAARCRELGPSFRLALTLLEQRRRARREAAPAAPLGLTRSGRSRFPKRFATEGVTLTY